MKHLGVDSAEAQALACASFGTTAPRGDLSGSGSPLECAEQPSPRRIRPRRPGCRAVAPAKGHLSVRLGARRQEEHERGEHGVREDANVEHHLVADVEGDRAGEGERVARHVQVEQRHDA